MSVPPNVRRGRRPMSRSAISSLRQNPSLNSRPPRPRAPGCQGPGRLAVDPAPPRARTAGHQIVLHRIGKADLEQPEDQRIETNGQARCGDDRGRPRMRISLPWCCSHRSQPCEAGDPLGPTRIDATTSTVPVASTRWNCRRPLTLAVGDGRRIRGRRSGPRRDRRRRAAPRSSARSYSSIAVTRAAASVTPSDGDPESIMSILSGPAPRRMALHERYVAIVIVPEMRGPALPDLILSPCRPGRANPPSARRCPGSAPKSRGRNRSLASAGARAPQQDRARLPDRLALSPNRDVDGGDRADDPAVIPRTTRCAP